jgi:hypothetical protein
MSPTAANDNLSLVDLAAVLRCRRLQIALGIFATAGAVAVGTPAHAEAARKALNFLVIDERADE